MWGNYGKVAIRATRHIQKTRECPKKTWQDFADKTFGAGTYGANKGCPRYAYLGLCADGLVIGISKGNYIPADNLNKLYGIQAVRMLYTDPSLENLRPKQLWDKVAEIIEEAPDNHNNQMNVVLALWHEGMIIKPT